MLSPILASHAADGNHLAGERGWHKHPCSRIRRDSQCCAVSVIPLGQILCELADGKCGRIRLACSHGPTYPAAPELSYSTVSDLPSPRMVQPNASVRVTSPSASTNSLGRKVACSSR